MEKRAFILNTVYWHEFAGKLNVRSIEDALNAHINLADYGGGVERILFTYIAVRPSNTIHENYAKYDAKTKTIDIGLKLSYEHLVAADSQKIMEMMVGLFLVSVDLYEGMGIKNFHKKQFVGDVKQVFAGLKNE